jgi:uncharacterized protein
MPNHPIVHVHIPTLEGKESAEFYANTFDWNLEHMPDYNYWQFKAGNGPTGGFLQASEAGIAINQLLVYIGTDDIAESLARIEANGGKTIQPELEIPGTGWFAIFSDPMGNSLALFKAIA